MCYVLSALNSIGWRLRSEQNRFFNLALAGAWTLNGTNTGCVEADTNSGPEAARGITTRSWGRSTPCPKAGSRRLKPSGDGRALLLSMFSALGNVARPLSSPTAGNRGSDAAGRAGVSVTIGGFTGHSPITLLSNVQTGMRSSFFPQVPIGRDT